MFYALLVILLSLYGGTDMMRFATFLFLPQALFVGLLNRMASRVEVFVMLVAVFIFNRIWMHVPMGDSSEYEDFFAGHGSTLNWSTAWRISEVLAFLVLSILVRKICIQRRTRADIEEPRPEPAR